MTKIFTFCICKIAFVNMTFRNNNHHVAPSVIHGSHFATPDTCHGTGLLSTLSKDFVQDGMNHTRRKCFFVSVREVSLQRTLGMIQLLAFGF